MSLTIDTLLKSQGEVHLQNIGIKWYFTPQADEENAIEREGTYNIDSYYDSHSTEIQHSRTQVTGFYEIFNKIQFTDVFTQDSFIIGVNHITEYKLADESLSLEFIFHRSIPQFAFNIEQPILAGVAEIISLNENLTMLQSLIHKNLHLHFSDHVFKIPRCNRCSSALTIHDHVDAEEEVINEDFVCMDCYTVINNFYNLLENEVYKIVDPAQMKAQRDALVKFVITGKKNASQIEETQLQHFYNLLIIYIEYLSGNLDVTSVQQKIQAVKILAESHNFPMLNQEADKLLNSLQLGQSAPPKGKIEPQSIQEEVQHPLSVHISLEPEPTPPPLPLGTPSPSTVIPPEEELSEGLQSLDSVQEELLSTLEALSQIESDLNPRPISPTDKMRALNMDLDEEDDKIPTFEDIKETFSDLESLDFPDIQFGTSTNVLEFPEEISEDDWLLNQVQENLETSPSFLNPPPGSTQDYNEPERSPPSINIPQIQELPQQEITTNELEIKEIEHTPVLNPPPGAFPKGNFTGQVNTMRDLDFGEESDYDADIKDGSSATIPLNPPPTLHDKHISPEWRDPSQTTPIPRMNSPLQTVQLPQMTPPAVNEMISEPKPPQIPKEPPQVKIPPRSLFFNNNGQTNNHTNPASVSKPKPAEMAPQPSPKKTRLKRDRSSKNRRIICSFCGQTMTQGMLKCPNCGSFNN